MKKILALICLIFIPSISFACLNGMTKILKNGVFVYEDDEGIVPHGHRFSIDNFEKVINRTLPDEKKAESQKRI